MMGQLSNLKIQQQNMLKIKIKVVMNLLLTFVIFPDTDIFAYFIVEREGFSNCIESYLPVDFSLLHSNELH